jgi:HD-GYP domain-containing protein (c-di-GMP phosphodiesterase class II)
MSLDEALLALRLNAGSQFDPAVVSALVDVIEQEPPAKAATPHTVEAAAADAPVPSR